MILDPDIYRCPTHGTDLTSLVRARLDSPDIFPFVHVIPVFAQIFKYLLTRTMGRREKLHAHPFEVIVSCPGNGAPHTLKCIGTVIQ